MRAKAMTFWAKSGASRHGQISYALIVSGVAIAIATSQVAHAQQARYEILPPEAQMTDSNGVDMTSGFTGFSSSDVKIGGSSGISNVVQSFNYAVLPQTLGPGIAGVNGFYKNFGAAGQVPQFITSFMGGLNVSTGSLAPDGSNAYAHTPVLVNGAYVFWNTVNFSFDGSSETFLTHSRTGLPWSETAPVGFSFTSVSKKGGALIYLGNFEYKYVSRSGTQYFLNKNNQIYTSFPMANWVVYKAIAPSGLMTRYNYSSGAIVSVERNDGFSIHYLRNASGKMTGAKAINDAVVRCSSLDQNCSPAGVWPTSSYAWAGDGSSFTIVDASGQSDIFYLDSYGRVSSRKDKTATVPNWQFTYCRRESPFDCLWSVGGVVTYYPDFTKKVIRNQLTYNYSLSPDGNSGRFWFYSRTDQFGGHLHRTFAYKGSGSLGVINEVKLPDSSIVNLSDDAINRVYRVSKDGILKKYTYDDRGNVTQEAVTPGSVGAVTLTTTAAYPATCTNQMTCNKPTSVTDPNGNVTQFTYDAVHGGVLTKTSPADETGLIAQTRYQYVQRAAVYLNSSGVMAPDPSPIWLLSSESACKSSNWTGTACAAGAQDEVVTSYDYGPTSGANNLLLRGIAVTADGTTRRTCYGYNQFGDKISETQPGAQLTSCP